MPLFKSGDPQYFSNYRPVSILPIFSKILEQLVYDRILSHINSHNLLYCNQFGFRNEHSPNLAMICLVDKISNAVSLKWYSIYLLFLPSVHGFMHETSGFFYSIITFSYTKYFVHSYTVDVVFTLSYWRRVHISSDSSLTSPVNHQGPISISEKTSFRKISWSLEAPRLVL